MAECTMQDSSITYKSIITDPVPVGLRELASEITTVVLVSKPIHIYSFVADFLQEQIMTRDSNEPPSHKMIRSMVENELTYEAMLKRWGVSTALANYAATIIQAVYRGYRTRRTMPKKMLEEAQVVEETVSEVSSTGSVELDEANRAAICIQRNFRQTVVRAKHEKPPGEPQQRRRPRVRGMSNNHHPSGLTTAPAELTFAFDSTSKEASVVVDLPPPEQQVQSSSSIPSLPRPNTTDSAAQTKLAVGCSLKQTESKSTAANKPHKQKSNQAVATPQKQAKQTVATSLKKEDAKQTAVVSPQKQVKQAVATSLKKEDAKQTAVVTPKKHAKQAVANSLKKEVAKQTVVTPQKQAKQTVVTPNKQVEMPDTTIPLDRFNESVSVVAPIIESLMWYVVDKACDPLSVQAATKQSSPATKDAAQLDNTVAEMPQLESLYPSPDEGSKKSSPTARSGSMFCDNHQMSLERDVSSIFVNRFESISVIQPPSRAAIGVESQEFYQAQECLSFTGNERAQLLLNRSSNSIKTSCSVSRSPRAVALQSEVDLTRTPVAVVTTRKDGDGGHHVDVGTESETLLPASQQVDYIDIDKATFDQRTDVDNI